MSRRVFRYEVPADDKPHTCTLHGDLLAVAALPDAAGVEFWAEHDDQAGGTDRDFQVFGTGHPLAGGAKWAGTCQRAALGLVWHLYEVPPS